MSNEKKSDSMLLRLTPTDKKNISYHAELMNISKTEYVSLCIRRKRIVVCENFPELIFQLSKIGNNINQIAAVANTNKYITENSIQEIKILMQRCYNLMNDFISFIAEPENDYLKNDTSKVSELLGELSNSVNSINSRLLKIERLVE